MVFVLDHTKSIHEHILDQVSVCLWYLKVNNKQFKRDLVTGPVDHYFEIYVFDEPFPLPKNLIRLS